MELYGISQGKRGNRVEDMGLRAYFFYEESLDSQRKRYLRNAQEGVSLWKVPQKITASIDSMLVRVKTCGKSARLRAVMCARGKPYLEQDKTVCTVFRSDWRVRNITSLKHAGISLR